MQTNYANLFSTEPLDRLEEIYLKTMNEMDDDTLKSFCSSAKYNARLCNDNFWLRRIKEHNLELLLPYRNLYPSLQSFYFNVRKDACYAVAEIDDFNFIGQYPSLFNDIKQALDVFDDFTRRVNGINADTQLDYTGLASVYEIYILFDNRLFTSQTAYSLFNIKSGSVNYINPNIENYPILSHAPEVLYNSIPDESEGTSEKYISPFDSDSLHSLPDSTDFYIIVIGYNYGMDVGFFWSKKLYGLRLYNRGNQTIVLIDTLKVDKRLITYAYFLFNNGIPAVSDYVAVVINKDVVRAIDYISDNFNEMEVMSNIAFTGILAGSLIGSNTIKPLKDVTKLMNELE